MALIYNSPSGFGATNVSASTIGLSWINGESVPVEIQRKALYGTYGTIDVAGSGETTYSDTDCSSNTSYYYRIRHKSGSDTSEWVLDDAYTNPAPPTGLAIAWSGKTATLTWTNGDTYTYVKAYYKLSSEPTTWKTISTTISGTAVTTNVTVTTENVNYDFRIMGYLLASTLNSTYNTVSASTSLMLAPDGMTLTSATTTSVTVTWVETSAVATHAEVYMDGALLTTVAAGVLTYTKTGLTISTTYAFKVRAKLGTVYSLFNTEVEIDTGVAPDAAAVIGTVAVVSANALTPSWTCAATNETGFCVYRSTDNVTYTLINTGTTANATSYADTGLTPDTLYYYKVQAYNAYGISAMSSSANNTTSLDLDPPTLLIADAISSTRIDLAFTVNAASATTHSVERKTTGSYSALGSTLTATQATYSDGTCAADTEYTYRIRAYHSTPATYGDYSAPISKKTLAVGVDTVRRNESYFAMGNILCIASETPQNSFISRWRSKPLDFSEIDPQDSNRFKTCYMVQLEYTDTYASVPVVISLSTDGGTTWTTSTETIGTGDGTEKSQDFWFSGVTGKYITLDISVTTATKGFTFTGATIHYISRGEYMEST